MVDSGASLGKPNDSHPLDQRRVKARVVAEAYAAGGIDAMALSASDWALGADFVRGLVAEHDLPVLAANLACAGAPSFPASRTVTVSGRRIGVIGVTDGEVPGCTVSPAPDAIRAAAAELSSVDFTVALVPATDLRGESQLLVGSSDDLGVDLVVDATNRSLQARPQERAGGWWISAGSRGRYLGVATLSFAGDGEWTFARGRQDDPEQELERDRVRKAEIEALLAKESEEHRKERYRVQIEAYERRIADLEAKVASPDTQANRIALQAVALDASVADDEVALAIVERGKESITASVEVKPTSFVTRKVPSGPFAGGETCVGCHPGPHAQWSTTGHARAWQALVTENRAFDDACWSCHVTGAEQVGGPTTARETGPFRDVQCEACHGPSRAHVDNPGEADAMPVRDPDGALCRTCHDGERDGGRFEPVRYHAKIVHEDAK